MHKGTLRRGKVLTVKSEGVHICVRSKRVQLVSHRLQDRLFQSDTDGMLSRSSCIEEVAFAL